MYPSEKKQIETIALLAKEAFAHHTLTIRLNQGLFRNWRCAKHGTGMHSFNVSTEPGRLFITGDVEAFIFQREEDMIPWLRKSIENREYLAEKIICGTTHEWSREIAQDWLDATEAQLLADIFETEERGTSDVLAVTRKRLISLRNAANQLEFGREPFLAALWDSGVSRCGDYPSMTGFTPGFLWACEALKRFLGHLDTDNLLRLAKP